MLLDILEPWYTSKMNQSMHANFHFTNSDFLQQYFVTFDEAINMLNHEYSLIT